MLGVDSSEEMLASAAARKSDRLSFVLERIQDWRPSAPIDVLVSNAALQWVPRHLSLLPRFVSALAPGGWLAIQVPGNFEAPSHATLRSAVRLAALVRSVGHGRAVAVDAGSERLHQRARRARVRGGRLGDDVRAGAAG